MSQVEGSPPELDRIDGACSRWGAVLLSLLAGVVIGGLIGAAYGAAQPPAFHATTAVSVLPDSQVLGQASQQSSGQDVSGFVQSQLVVLNGSDVADDVRKMLALGHPPKISSAEVGQTYVVQITATAAREQDAQRIAAATAAAFAVRRAHQLSEQVDSSLASVDKQIARIRAALDKVSPAAGSSGTAPALQTQYAHLLDLQGSLILAQQQVNGSVFVVSPPSDPGSGLSVKKKDAIGGGLLGALLGITGLIGIRRARPRLRCVADLAALGVPVLLPLMRRRRSRLRQRAGWRSGDARLLAARLTTHGSTVQAPIILAGATKRVGTSFVAASIAAGIAERGPVLLILAGECADAAAQSTLVTAELSSVGGPDPSQAGDLIDQAVASVVPGVWVLPCSDRASSRPAWAHPSLAGAIDRATAAGWLVVVDAPPLAVSDLALDLVAGHRVVALVVGRQVSRPADVIGAADLLYPHGPRFKGVILNDVPRWFRRTGSRPVLAAGTANSAQSAARNGPSSPTVGGSHRRSASDEVPGAEPLPMPNRASAPYKTPTGPRSARRR